MPLAMRLLCTAAIVLAAALTRAIVGQGLPADAVRVTVSINADGSRTTYRFDDAHHTAAATTTTREGKLLGTTRYTLDDAGHFATGEVYGADSKLRFKSVYKYDDAGRQTQEIQSDKSDNVLHKIVYTYDSLGKPTGYAVYDGAGRLISQSTAPRPSATTTKKKKSH